MAMGFFAHHAGDAGIAWSGGTEPGIEVNPAAVAAMAERGIDISREYPKPWTDEVVRAADAVISMGCGGCLPHLPGQALRGLGPRPTPTGCSVEDVRPIRDDIERRVLALLDELGLTPAHAPSPRRHPSRSLMAQHSHPPATDLAAPDLRLRRLGAEFLGTGLLVTVVVGSGIAAERLSPDDVGLQLLENSTATFLGLTVLILMFGPISGAHFNPVVSAADWLLGPALRRPGCPGPDVLAYTGVQTLGAIAGAELANVMFKVPLTELSTKDRTGANLLVSEVVATAGLVVLIFALARTGRGMLAAPAVGAYIGAAYWFTSSTSFANPAVTDRPRLLRHLRRHRTRLGARVRRRPARRRRRRRRRSCAGSTPTSAVPATPPSTTSSSPTAHPPAPPSCAPTGAPDEQPDRPHPADAEAGARSRRPFRRSSTSAARTADVRRSADC